MSEILAIGSLRFPMDGVAVVVTYKSKRKVTEKVADGDDDATAVDGGREVRGIDVTFRWADTPAARRRTAVIVSTLDPSQKNPDAPPAWAHAEDDGSADYGALKGVRNVIAKEASGPDKDPEKGIVTYKVTFDSWAKTSPKTAKTEKGGGFVLGSQSKYNGANAAQAAELKKRGVPMQKPAVKP